MSNYKEKIIALFGEEHLESDEEFLYAERQLKQRLRNAFGEDSEDDNTSLTDVMELSCSDIEEEEEKPTNISVNRITTQPQPEDCLAHRKALAQYQRQIAACVTRQHIKKPSQLPPHIIARREGGDIRSPLKEDIFLNEEELVRTTERMMYGRTLQQVTEEVLSKSTVNQYTAPPIPVIPPVEAKKSRKEKRVEAKKKWFLKKKVKTIS